MYIPVLPARINGKLVFTLCFACAKHMNETCTHQDKDRILEGTWITLEVQEALKQGYKIIEIFEVCHYPQTDVYDKSIQSGGLFTEYVDLFLKYKQEASGYPDDVLSDQEKEEYIKNYHQKEGIKLERQNINYNSGLRSVMKLMLNSFWGEIWHANKQNKGQIYQQFKQLV